MPPAACTTICGWSWTGVSSPGRCRKGPSLDPQDKRLAVEVEDHPLDYGDFEGTIPKGQYGGGTVMLWDRGYWAPEKGFENIGRALDKGELKFVMEGERLHGSWVLVRIKARRARPSANWLLIKHRDEAAVDGQRRRSAATRTARSPPAAPWRRSPPARAGAPSRS